MAYIDEVTPREAVRTLLRDRLRELTDAAVQRVDLSVSTDIDTPNDEPLWQNVPVVTVKDLEAAIHATFGEALPAPSERTAEVATPATIFVAAECPRCHLPGRIPLTVSVELHQDDSSETLHLKGKSKAAIHFCGQMALPERQDDADGQEELPFDEPEEEASGTAPMEGDQKVVPFEKPAKAVKPTGRVDEEAGVVEVESACPMAGCNLPAEHPGQHVFLA
jgi:hypothetical protein